MKRHKKTKKNLSEKIVKKLDIPEDVVFDIPRLIMMSNTEIRIENYKSILEYEADKISLSAKNMMIELFGSDFNICLMTDEEVSITGTILSVNFSKLGS